MPINYQPQPPTQSRPLNPRYRNSDTFDMMPDLVVRQSDLGNITNIAYLCYKYAADERITNCWKIMRVATEIIIDSSGNAIETQTIKYPFGCEGYNFNPEHIELLHQVPVWLNWKFDYKW